MSTMSKSVLILFTNKIKIMPAEIKKLKDLARLEYSLKRII
jgi:hypothetical protein